MFLLLNFLPGILFWFCHLCHFVKDIVIQMYCLKVKSNIPTLRKSKPSQMSHSLQIQYIGREFTFSIGLSQQDLRNSLYDFICSTNRFYTEHKRSSAASVFISLHYPICKANCLKTLRGGHMQNDITQIYWKLLEPGNICSFVNHPLSPVVFIAMRFVWI